MPKPLLSPERHEALRLACNGERTSRELCEAFGVPLEYVHTHMHRWRKQGYAVATRRPRMAVSVRGTVYENAAIAAAALGVDEKTVLVAVAHGATDKLGLGRGKQNKGRTPAPVIFFGRTFPSVSYIARLVRRSKRGVRDSLAGGERAKQALLRQIMQAELTQTKMRGRVVVREKGEKE